MAALDHDEDGVLSAEEIDQAVESMLTLDKNEDGNLTGDELAPSFGGDRGGRGGRGGRGDPGGPGGRGGPPGMSSMMIGGMSSMFAGLPLMKALDLDRDGELFEDEVEDAPELLAGIDMDGDGELSEDELAPSEQERGGLGGMRGFGGGRGGPGRGFGGFGGRGEGGGRTLEPSEVKFEDGVAEITEFETFEKLSYKGEELLIDTHLADLRFIKFTFVGARSDDEKIYFINTKTHRAHMMFGSVVGIPFGGRSGGSGTMKGVLVHRPQLLSPSGQPGLFTFEFEPFDSYSYDMVRAAFDELCEKAPILKGNLAYHTLPQALPRYEEERAQYEEGELPVFLPTDLYKDIAYLPLNQAEGLGRLRLMDGLEERPGPRDIVLYPVLPNEMSRVAGIITAVPQTPLSHVNLRATQDGVPNAYIAGSLDNEDITRFLDRSVYYRVGPDGYEIRAATSEEVERHFADLRPSESQVPPRDLSVTGICSLDDIGFEGARAFGVKASNMAAMRGFGFPETVIPAGLAVPFSMYDAFMRHNGFYDLAAAMIAEEEFQKDPDEREKALSKLRKKIRKGSMPDVIRTALGDARAHFPEGTSIRCRSSTNNEDLPGLSGAGLYDSCTHYPHEGHLEKSIKQVYASLWNFRAYEEREFFRIDHMQAAMGVLMHPRFSDEQANGVAVTDDIVYQSEDLGVGLLYYVNTQLGEDLVTNPEGYSVPEEILLAPRNPENDRVVRRSNRVEDGRPLMSDAHLLELRRYLRTIHKEFARLYEVPAGAEFAMEIEFKITRNGDLSIKQARPWVY